MAGLRKKKKDSEQTADPEYATVQNCNLNTEVDQKQLDTLVNAAYGVPAPVGAVTKDSNETDKSQCKQATINCALALVIALLVFAIVAGCSCFVAVFIEIQELKSAGVPDSEQQQVKLIESIQTLLNKQVAMLNASFNSFKQSAFESTQAQLDEQLAMLNSSFNSFKQSATQTQLDENEIFEAFFNELNQISRLLNTSLGSLDNRIWQLEAVRNPVSVCSALHPSSPSGYYWMRASNGSAVRVYCDMSRSCGGVTGGWMRVAELDMTNSSHQCPSGLRQRTDSTIRTCVSSSSSAGCSSDIIFETHGISYSRVCGQVIGYQIGHTNAFASQNESISGDYVDGVSLTHGSPRQHIWTFAAARDDRSSGSSDSKCPCITNGISQPSQFVGEDYFCDTSAGQNPDIFSGEFFTNLLWNGQGCVQSGIRSNNCCDFNSPPWFYKPLPQPTTDNIEMRICRNEEQRNEDIAIEILDIYVQ